MEETNNIEAVYRVNRIDEENKMDITIIVENKIENIEYIITPEEEKINFNNKKKVAIDYKIEENKIYDFKIKMQNGQEETYILNENEKPNIIYNGGYAKIAEYKIEYPEDTVTIDYGENTQNYYSVNNGETWEKYENNIQIQDKCTILAKSLDNNKINKIEQKEVKLYEDDAIRYEAIDNDLETCMRMHQNVDSGTATRYIKIDPSIWEKKITIKWWNWDYSGYYSTIECLDENNEVLETYRLESNQMKDEIYYIPQNTVKLKYFVVFADSWYQNGPGQGFGKLYEIQPTGIKQPEIINAYPKITSGGVVKQSFKIKADEETKIYYKIDSDDWKEYSESDQIFLNIGQTLYAKGSDKKEGIYFTDITSYINNNEIGEEAYDKNDDTYVVMQYGTPPGTAKRYLDVDESIWGKKLRIKWWNWTYNGYYSTIKFLDSEGKALATYRLNSGESKNEEYNIPNNSVRLEYFVSFAGADWWSNEGFGKLYEIEVKD